MAEMIGRDGNWTFDGDVLRIVPGRDRSVSKFRKALGEVAVPVRAVSGVAFEPGRKGGRLRLRLRPGADPVLQVAGGKLVDRADPYQLQVGADRTGAAEYFVDEVRYTLQVEQISDGPTDRYLLPGPTPPVSATGYDGSIDFDGRMVRLEWNWMTSSAKSRGGPQGFDLDSLAGVEWVPGGTWDWSFVRFVPKGAVTRQGPEYDPTCVRFYGERQATRAGAGVVVAAAVVARLPHPSVLGDPGRSALQAGSTDQAALQDHSAGSRGSAGPGDGAAEPLARLRELGELHNDGILTDDEFASAKAAILRQLGADSSDASE